MRIAPMEARHIAAIAAIERACFSEPWSEQALREELQNPAACFLVAEDEGGAALGYIGCQTVLDEGYIANVATAPANRRQGVARALVRALAAEAAARGLSFLTLEVRASNAPAIALYRGEGFAPAGARRGFYRDPPEDALLMTRYLQPGEDVHGT